MWKNCQGFKLQISNTFLLDSFSAAVFQLCHGKVTTKETKEQALYKKIANLVQ